MPLLRCQLAVVIWIDDDDNIKKERNERVYSGIIRHEYETGVSNEPQGIYFSPPFYICIKIFPFYERFFFTITIIIFFSLEKKKGKLIASTA
jgi:hypothetical protein